MKKTIKELKEMIKSGKCTYVWYAMWERGSFNAVENAVYMMNNRVESTSISDINKAVEALYDEDKQKRRERNA